ncbi:unnamed protein product [Protopolystoma xenopodis]|uniref:Uncharacterized protein n=1 Tax=Protopolystoma xenopodis TaxID=117903 RepID=A0A448WU59_9PLAT|nr:unnamed protein product [Protopolystoma xenopodis]
MSYQDTWKAAVHVWLKQLLTDLLTPIKQASTGRAADKTHQIKPVSYTTDGRATRLFDMTTPIDVRAEAPERRQFDALAFGLAVTLTLDETHEVLRQVLASLSSAPKLLKVASALVYKLTQTVPGCTSAFKGIAIQLAKTSHWDCLLRPYLVSQLATFIKTTLQISIHADTTILLITLPIL